MCYKKIIWSLILLTGFLVNAQETLTKTIDRNFEFSNSGEFHLENKYGNVSITGWDKDELSVTIEIKVSIKKKDNAKALIDRFEPNIKSGANYVSIVSEFSEKNTSAFTRYFNKVNPFEIDRGNVEINYIIQVPENIELDVSNKFGDIIIDSWSGKIKANVEHGDLWLNNDVEHANIDIKFGKLRTQFVDYASVNLKNGSLDINEINTLILESSGSNVEIETIGDLEIISSKDEIEIQEIKKINGSLKFSNAEINKIENQIDLEMHVAGLKVREFSSPAPLVDIIQESSEVRLNITGLTFKFSATLEQGLFRIPKTVSNLKNTVIDDSKRIRTISGQFGQTNLGNFTFVGKKGVIVFDE